MHGSWLDIGCGSGALAAEWIRQQRTGLYHGIDFSPNLIAEAGEEILGVPQPVDLEMQLSCMDLVNADWELPLSTIRWDGALCFAVLHHIPGTELRQRICASIGGLLGRQKKLYLSVWQVRNSPRLMQRILPWSQAGMKEDDLDAGDVLMDWRAGTEGDGSFERHPVCAYFHRK